MNYEHNQIGASGGSNFQILQSNVQQFASSSPNATQTSFSCFVQDFPVLEDATKVYEQLQKIHHENIARPLCLFRGPEENTTFVSLEKEGQDLGQFLRRPDNKRLFYLYRNENDTTPYAPSELFVSLLRGLINGINQLKGTEIAATLDVKHIYVVEGVSKRFVLTNFYLCAASSRANHSESSTSTSVHQTGVNSRRYREWDELVKLLAYLARDFTRQTDAQTSSYTDYQMSSFNALFKQEMPEDLNKVLDEPIFWCWRRRKDLIIFSADVLEHISTWLYGYRDVYTALSQWRIKFDRDTKLNILRTDDPNGGFINVPYSVHMNIPNRKNSEIAKGRIKFIRNIYCHFYDKKKRLQVDIDNPEEVENIFYQTFPELIYALARVAPDLVAEFNRRWNVSSSIS